MKMKFETMVLAGTLAFGALAPNVVAQVVVASPDEQIFLVQGPVPPVAPVAPVAPMSPMGDVIRLMASNGSYLGVGVRDITAERKTALNLKEERGAEVTSVEENSPGAKAGLKAGDVVLEYAGQRVESMEQFIRLVRETPAGREVKISVSRGGNMASLMAKPESGRTRMERTIGITNRNLNVAEMRGWTMPVDSPRAVMSWRSGSLGVEAESLNNQLAEYFGVKQGVLVRSVGKDTPAEKAGVKAGDVIVKVEDTRVESPRDVTNAVGNARQKGKTVSLGLMREKRETTLKVTFDEELPGTTLPRSRSVINKFVEQ